MRHSRPRRDPRLIAVRGILIAIALFSTLTFSGAFANAQINPDSLLIYYGWPSAINGSFTVPNAAAQFSRYDLVVLGDGLQNGPGTSNPHPDYYNTLGIVNSVATAETDFFGYVDLGVTTQNLPMSEVFRRIDGWKAMGLEGVLLDDFGYDFGVTRARQNAAVDYAHSQGMNVIANGFRPEDVFSTAVHPNNPQGLSPVLGENDFYLYESHQIRIGKYDFTAAWTSKARELENFQEVYGFEILSITTNDPRNAYDEDEFFFAWYSAALYGHAGTGWGEYVFSASGAGNAQAPFRERPDVNLGFYYFSDVKQLGSRYNRKTEEGVIFVDTSTRDYGLLPTGDMDGNGRLDAFDINDLELALADRGQYQQTYPKLDPELLGDTNFDGEFDASDIGIFEAMLTARLAAMALSVPSPSSALTLLALAAIAPRRGRRRE